MALLQKLKSLLGFDGADSERSRSREVGVTVEREGTADDGTETAAARDRTEDVRAEPPQSAATDTADEVPAEATDADVAAESESDVTDSETATEPETTDETDAERDIEAEAEPDIEAEPAVEVESEAESEPDTEAEPDIEEEPGAEPEPEPKPEPDGEPELEPEPDIEEAEPESVTEIKGIGPAYADRLAGAGVETVAELAASDAAELADQTDISEKRIQGWIDRAEVR
ncbi:DUF4332 domain-containing protein [Haloarchaeobius amylolyticus]|uniref:DUF4332 domain-containing protein n=1 Tax=Haloarchaeobius amylolyticus TaxID=1198296 RepID=A0ABD6BFH2_9EURY